MRVTAKRKLLAGLALLGIAGAGAAPGQSVTLVPNAVRYAGIGTSSRGYNTDFGAGGAVELNLPGGVAFDLSGNLLLADTGNNCVRRVDTSTQHLTTTVAGLATGSTDTCNATINANPAPSQGLLSPSAVAVDIFSNIYIADRGHNCIRELPAGTTGTARAITVAGTCGSTASASNTPQPTALAVDSSGNLYIAISDTVGGVYQVLRHDAGSGSGDVCRVAGDASPQGVAQCTGLTSSPSLRAPSGLAVDGSGGLFISDTGNNCIRRLSSGAFSVAAGVCGGTSAVQGPGALAVNAQGILFFTSTFYNQLLRYDGSTGTAQVVAGNPNTSPGAYSAAQDGIAATGVPLNAPAGVALDSSGNAYVADSANNIVRQLRYNTTFPNTAVGQTSPSQQIFYAINRSSTLSLAAGQDYAVVAGSDTCTGSRTPAASGSSPASCSLSVVFRPTAPGRRASPLRITDTSRAAVVSTALQGVGTGPLAHAFPGIAGTFAAASAAVRDVKHDTAGNIYALTSSGGQFVVLRYPAGGGSPVTVVAGGAGLSNPQNIAVDGAGNIYVSDLSGSSSGTATVQRYGADGTVNRDYGAGVDTPGTLAVDNDGNLLLTEQGTHNDLLKLFAGGERAVVAGGGSATPAEGVSAASVLLGKPQGIAVGADDTVYFADAALLRVFSVDAYGLLHLVAGTGSSTPTASLAASSQSLVRVSGLETDAAGDLFIADAGANAVYQLFAASPAGNNIRRLIGLASGAAGSTGDAAVSTAAALNNPLGVTVTGDGTVYVADTGNNKVRQITFPNPTLDFGSVAVNSSNTANQSFLNVGNDFLQRTGDPVISNPLFTNNAAGTTCGVTVVAGLLCDFSFNFNPVVTGTPSATATVTHNGSNSPLVITLRATVVPAVITGFTAQAETEIYGGPWVGTVTISTNGGTTPTGTVTFRVNGTITCSVAVTQAGSVSCTLPGGTLLPVTGSPYPVSVTYTGNYPNQAASTTLTVSPRGLTETVNNQTKVYLAPVPRLSGNPDGVLGGVGNDSFTITYGFGATPISITTPPGAYTNDIVATATPNGATSAANYTVQIIPGTFTVTKLLLDGLSQPALTQVYGGPLTLSAGYTPTTGAPAPTGTITFTIGTQTLCTATLAATTSCTVAAGTGLPVGTYTVTAAYSGDAYYNAASSGTQLTVTPAPLSITVADQTKAFGAAVPNLAGTATVTGLVNGDTVGTTILLTYSTTVTASTPVGTYPNAITVAVGGSSAANYTISIRPGTFLVGGTATSTTLTASASAVVAGVPVTFKATVTSASAVPAGSVVFSADGAVLGTVTLDANGTASLTTTALKAGTRTITAAYAGNANFAGSSASLTEAVTVPVGSFTLTGTPDSQFIRGAGKMSYTVTLQSVNGFAGTVSLGCTGLPTDASCALSQASATLAAGGSATITVTTTTTEADATAFQVIPRDLRPWQAPWSGSAAALSTAATFPFGLSSLSLAAAGLRRRRKAGNSKLVFLLFLTIGLLALAGCGCPSTAFHIYPVTVTGSSVGGGPASASTTMYLAVGLPQ